MLIHGFEIDETNLPRHIGIIMDGNRRWAVKNNKKKLEGHRQGITALRELLNFAYDILHLEIISLYSFSTENWDRNTTEVSFLMKLFSYFYRYDFKEIVKKKVKIIHSGFEENLPARTVKILNKMTEQTKDYDKGIINLAFNYGGRQEIIAGIKKLFGDIKSGSITEEEITSQTFSNYLFHPDIPDPDLIIRTSGEIRLSNFLLWQSAYSELYFTDIYWPDFKPANLTKAIYEYQQRERRYGG